MPTKLHIHVEPENPFLGPTDDFVELCRLPLEGGRPYLAQARGLLSLEGGVMVRLKLDLCGTFGEVIDSQDSDYINNHQQFVMTAAATLPAEGGGGDPPPPGASANLSVRVFWPAHQPGHSVGFVDIVLTALEVDEVVTA